VRSPRFGSRSEPPADGLLRRQHPWFSPARSGTELAGQPADGVSLQPRAFRGETAT
jgi:hypothetical protein